MADPRPMDPENLRAAYSVLSAARIAYDVRKMDVVRTSSIFVLAVFAASAGLLAQEKPPAAVDIASGCLLVVSPLLFGWWAREGIRREARLQYKVEFSMYQIERLLGLHQAIDESERWLPEQPTIFGATNVSWEHLTSTPSSPAPATGRDLSWWLNAKTEVRGFVHTATILFAASFAVSAVVAAALFTRGLS